MNYKEHKTLLFPLPFVPLSALSAQKSAGRRSNRGYYKNFRFLRTPEQWCAGITLKIQAGNEYIPL